MTSYLDAAERFTATVTATTDWSAPSPCADWTAADVVAHVIDSEREFFARHDLDLGDRPAGPPAQAWADHLAAVHPYAVDEDVTSREFDGFFGRTTVGATLDAFYGFDLLVHGWDLGSSNGRPTAFTESDLDAIEAALEGFGDHAYDDGVFGRPVDAPHDADRQTRLLARMGRRSPVTA